MLKINEKYYIDSDSCNYILLEKSIVKDEKSKNYGKEVYKNVAYYGNVNSLYNGLIEKEIKENVELLNNIEKIIELKEEMLKVEQ
jgi:hypothetical protein